MVGNTKSRLRLVAQYLTEKATHLNTAINAVEKMHFICKYPKGHIDMFVNGMALNSWEEGKGTGQMSSNSCLVI